MKKVLVLGATGRTGNAIIRQLKSDKPMEIVAALRDKEDIARIPQANLPLQTTIVDIESISSLRHAISQSDIIINAIRLRGNISPNALIELDRRIRQAIDDEKQRIIVTVGGAGSLLLSNGRHFWEDNRFPEKTLPRGIAHANLREYLETNVREDSWTYLIPPPAYLPNGPKTGRYTKWNPSTNEINFLKKSISYEDFAVAVSTAVHEGWTGTHLIGNSED